MKMRTFEVWDKATGSLVAGELGYACGDVYTSLSGFSRMASAGRGAVRGHGETAGAERLRFVGPGHGAALQDEARGATAAARRVPQTAAASSSGRRAPALPARVLPAADRLSKGPRRVAAGDGRQRFRYIRDDGVDGHRLKFEHMCPGR